MFGKTYARNIPVSPPNTASHFPEIDLSNHLDLEIQGKILY